MIAVFLTKTMQQAKEKANTFPKLFDTYFFKALNPHINIDQKLVYIRKLRLNTLILLGYLNDIEAELIQKDSEKSRENTTSFNRNSPTTKGDSDETI